MRSLSRSGVRLLACVLLSTAPVLAVGVSPVEAVVGVSPAVTTKLTPAQTNWFWSQQTSGRQIPTPNGAIGTPGDGGASGVPHNDLGIANTMTATPEGPAVGPDREPFLAWDFGDVLDATVKAFTVTVAVDTAATNNVPPNAAPALMACVALSDWGNNEGEDTSAKPKVDCKNAVKATYDASKRAWTFNLTALAQKWANGDLNYGITLRGQDGENPFTLSLLNKRDGKTLIPSTLVYLPAPPTPTSLVPPPVTAVTATSGTGASGTGASGTASSGQGSGLSGSVGSGDAGLTSGPAGPAPLPADAGGAPLPGPDIAGAAVPAPAAAGQPALAGGAPQPAALRRTASMRPTAGLYLGGFALLVALVAASLVSGAGGRSAVRPEGGVARALRTRGAGGLRL